MVLPIGVENTFKGVYDLLNEEAIVWGGDELGAKFEIKKEIPSELNPDDVKKYRDLLVEVISETDDKLMEKYLEGVLFETKASSRFLMPLLIICPLPLIAGQSKGLIPRPRKKSKENQETTNPLPVWPLKFNWIRMWENSITLGFTLAP